MLKKVDFMDNQKPKILYELYNLSIPQGTGIATYSRNLINAAHNIGYEINGLFNSSRKLNFQDKLLDEIGFFDARNKEPESYFEQIKHSCEIFPKWIWGDPFGLDCVEMTLNTVVLEPQKKSIFSPLARQYYAYQFMDRSRFHFKRYANFLSVNIPFQLDIFHATQLIPMRVKRAKNIYTIHDIIPLKLPYYTLDEKKYYLKSLQYIIKNADFIFTVSESSKQDLVQIAGAPAEKIINTYQSVSFPQRLIDVSSNESRDIIQNSFNIKSQDYFLYYGGIEPKKNISGVIDAYLASNTSCKLVIVGGLGWSFEKDLKKINESRSKAHKFEGKRFVSDERIIYLSYLSLFHLVALIRNAKAVIFPSFYEGFGLPVAESMMLGTPVITSNTSSMPEISGDAALIVSPYDIREISEAIRKIDKDISLRNDLRAKGYKQSERFSPSAYEQRLRKAYSIVLNGHQ